MTLLARVRWCGGHRDVPVGTPLAECWNAAQTLRDHVFPTLTEQDREPATWLAIYFYYEGSDPFEDALAIYCERGSP